MMAGLPVFAVGALAVVSASDPQLKALAVVLAAARSLALAAISVRGHLFLLHLDDLRVECPRIPLKNGHPRLFDYQFMFVSVRAIEAAAILAADASTGEALAVELETLGPFAGAFFNSWLCGVVKGCAGRCLGADLSGETGQVSCQAGVGGIFVGCFLYFFLGGYDRRYMMRCLIRL